MNDSGLLIVVSGPSGAGKGTICSALREQFPNIQYSISMTTRDPRPGEVDGVNYYFADNARFEQLLAEDAFLEHATREELLAAAGLDATGIRRAIAQRFPQFASAATLRGAR